MPAPQFGDAQAGMDYADRPAAFGIALLGSLIAVVQVIKDEGYWLDLPGGAIDPGEDAAAAVVREFGEETGLKVKAGDAFVRADQRFVNTDGKTYNNRATFFEIEVLDDAPDLKIEDDHTLAWISADEAIRRLRHEAQAWAVAAWLRLRTER